MIKFKNVLNDKVKEIDDCLYEIKRFHRFPGEYEFLNAKDLFIQCENENTLFGFYKFVFETQNEFKMNIENLNKVLSFYNSAQIEIFKKACEIVDEHDDNKISLNNDELNIIVGQINSIIQLEEPYSDIPNLNNLNKNYEIKFNELLKEKQNHVCNKIDDDLNELINLLDSDILIQQFTADIENDFNNLKYKVNNRRKIHEIMGFADDSLKLKDKYVIKINQFTDSPSELESVIYIGDILNEEVDIKDNEDLDKLLNKIREEITKELDVNDIVKIR